MPDEMASRIMRGKSQFQTTTTSKAVLLHVFRRLFKPYKVCLATLPSKAVSPAQKQLYDDIQTDLSTYLAPLQTGDRYVALSGPQTAGTNDLTRGNEVWELVRIIPGIPVRQRTRVKLRSLQRRPFSVQLTSSERTWRSVSLFSVRWWLKHCSPEDLPSEQACALQTTKALRQVYVLTQRSARPRGDSQNCVLVRREHVGVDYSKSLDFGVREPS